MNTDISCTEILSSKKKSRHKDGHCDYAGQASWQEERQPARTSGQALSQLAPDVLARTQGLSQPKASSLSRRGRCCSESYHGLKSLMVWTGGTLKPLTDREVASARCFWSSGAGQKRTRGCTGLPLCWPLTAAASLLHRLLLFHRSTPIAPQHNSLVRTG